MKNRWLIYFSDRYHSSRLYFSFKSLPVFAFAVRLTLSHLWVNSILFWQSGLSVFQNDGETLAKKLVHLATLVYNLSEIFVIMYFGSDGLCYRLFESNWIDTPQKTKKCSFIFGELLMQLHELVIGSLYPLTLETFRRVYLKYFIFTRLFSLQILNFAYNTFNILEILN